MRRRGPTDEISFGFGERKRLLSMVIIDVAANTSRREQAQVLGSSPQGASGMQARGHVALSGGCVCLPLARALCG